MRQLYNSNQWPALVLLFAKFSKADAGNNIVEVTTEEDCTIDKIKAMKPKKRQNCHQ